MNKKAIWLLIFAATLSGVSLARVHHADTMKELVKDLRENDSGLSFVLFYYQDKKMDRDMRQQVKDLLNEFKEVSTEEENVRFISVNLAREKAEEIRDRYARYATDQNPFFLLFKNGSTTPFKDKSGKVPFLTGFVDQARIRSLMNQSFEQEIKDAVKRKRKEREERRRARWYYGPSFYLGWDSPYYYRSPYYPYGYYGWGWRTGWGW